MSIIFWGRTAHIVNGLYLKKVLSSLSDHSKHLTKHVSIHPFTYTSIRRWHRLPCKVPGAITIPLHTCTNGRATGSTFGLCFLPEDASTCRLQGLGIKPLTIWLLGDCSTCLFLLHGLHFLKYWLLLLPRCLKVLFLPGTVSAVFLNEWTSSFQIRWTFLCTVIVRRSSPMKWLSNWICPYWETSLRLWQG